jgi:DNA-directed RNA polymerase subunit H (RpoH/RPB5)
MQCTTKVPSVRLSRTKKTPTSRELLFSNIVEMLGARGYVDIKLMEMSGTTSEIPSLVVTGKMTNSKRFVLYVVDALKFNVNLAEIYLGAVRKTEAQKGIILYKDSITGFAKRVLETSSLDIEIFSSKSLQINITKHHLQPRSFRCIEGDERRDFDRLKWTNFIPKMSRADPIARYYDFHKNDVIEIVRRNGEKHFRLVT